MTRLPESDVTIFSNDPCSLAAIFNRDLTAESSDSTCPCFSRLLLPIFWRCRRFERSEKRCRDSGHFIDSSRERLFIDSRRRVEAGNFSDELQRGGANLCLGDRWFEIMKDLNVSTHTMQRIGQSNVPSIQLNLKSYR
jgi:hypothetical protein